jgi:hypothetical protein
VTGFGGGDPRSIFNADGDLRSTAGSAVNVGDYVDVRNVDWPKIPGYDWDHARHTAQLTDHMSGIRPEQGGIAVFSAVDIRIMSAAALLHDVGRTVAGDDPEHYRKGAEIADSILATQAGWGADERNEVCRLIFKHGDRDAARMDRRLQVIQDADRLEAARFKSFERLKNTCKPELFWSPWAAQAGTIRAWLKFSGWQV